MSKHKTSTHDTSTHNISRDEMSTYHPESLLERWVKGKLTLEMAIGHILQCQLDHEARLRRLERQAQQPPSAS